MHALKTIKYTAYDSLPIAVGLVAWWMPTVNPSLPECTVRISLCLAVGVCVSSPSFNSHAKLQFKTVFFATRKQSFGNRSIAALACFY